MILREIYNFRQLDNFIPIQLDGLKNGNIYQFGFTTNELRTIRVRYEKRNKYVDEQVFSIYYRGRLFGLYNLNEYQRISKDIVYLLCKYGWETTHTILNGGEH